MTVDPNGTKHQVATLDDGLKFAGDSGDAIAKKLNEVITISGGVTDETKLTDKNVGVVAKDGKLNVKLAKNLTGLESATFTKTVENNGKKLRVPLSMTKERLLRIKTVIPIKRLPVV